MYARIVTVPLKAGDVSAFARLMEQDVIPVLKKQAGFRDELVLAGTDGQQGLSITLWERKEDADAYHRAVYPDLLKKLDKVLAGTPEVRTYDVTNSTLHKITARAMGM